MGGAFVAPPLEIGDLRNFSVFPVATRYGSIDALFYQLPPIDHDIGFLKLLLFMLFLSRVDVAFLRRAFFDLLFLFMFLFLYCSVLQLRREQCCCYLPVLCRTLRPTFFATALQLRPNALIPAARSSVVSYSLGSNPNPHPYGIIFISPFCVLF